MDDLDLLELSESEDAILKVDFCQFHNVTVTVPGFHNCYRVEAVTGVQTKTGLLGGCSVLHHHDELRVSIVAWNSRTFANQLKINSQLHQFDNEDDSGRKTHNTI